MTGGRGTGGPTADRVAARARFCSCDAEPTASLNVRAWSAHGPIGPTAPPAACAATPLRLAAIPEVARSTDPATSRNRVANEFHAPPASVNPPPLPCNCA
ncbi:hypothetical protein [Actinomycetospora termitidis]|uniref:Uncharacterized protein n=1 Tax=Actinomycetospora termitidis TaxID=3053470 RepID=A0ABT7MAH6_9PSEU|nr:hypothetical protein [Actinomycetospora sp. Odt1-22]MDL5157623.1 hypothetical protein [Actinomycetospora sp. Odt1-22]